MPEQPNYLLGYGERLTVPIEARSGGGPKPPPYTFQQAQARLAPMLARTATELESLPDGACPNGEAVVALTLHPEYVAKSHFPAGFLRSAGLRSVGSRPRRIIPDRRSRARKPKEEVTSQLFVAGPRPSFRRIAEEAPAWTPKSPAVHQLPALELVSAIRAEERVRPLPDGDEPLVLEVVLHASDRPVDRFILAGFRDYLEELEIAPNFRRTFHAGGLCFLPVLARAAQAKEIARYSFLRVLRAMPGLRPTRPVLRSHRGSARAVNLPQQEAVAPKVRVAVFDGGLRSNSPLTRWASARNAPGVGRSHPDELAHGEGVTSALLFGTLGVVRAERPVCTVDHYRVLDDSNGDSHELPEVLHRVKTVLDQGNYEFFNLSIGPDLPVDDDDVHAWTAVLDEHLSDGRSLATLAAGNTGEEPDDPVLQKWRVQVPSDCVNAVTVGATDRLLDPWRCAPYSSRGPGRSPGIVKPDLVAFGGSRNEPFWVLDPNSQARAVPTCGTSYAAPVALRAAAAVRAYFGPVLTPLAIRALMVHAAESGDYPKAEVGWGRIPARLDDVVVCPPGCVRIVYQDTMTAASHRRIPIPIPRTGLRGLIRITATFCFAVSVDAAHPGTYTRGGLSVVFRPHKGRFKANAEHPESKTFFQAKELYGDVDRLPNDALQWETCLHQRIDERSTNLDDPVFDIHYSARAGGKNDPSASPIRYALVLTVEAKGVHDLYDRVRRTHRTKLEPLIPVLNIPARPRTSLFS